MKLLSKLTLFITLSKLAVVVLFVLLLPALVGRVAFQYTNYYLGQQEEKVIDVIKKNGIDYYLQGDSSYGSYTLLKEEYISLEPADSIFVKDTIQTSRRIVELDTLDYRVLTHEFSYGSKRYVLEIGKTTATISEYNQLLQRFTLYVLIGLIAITILIDLVFTRRLLKPLGVIISTKLLHRNFPFKEPLHAVKTSTADFKYLDNSIIDLMGRINEAFEKEREFTSNASHELMTPVSILQTRMENLMMDSGGDEVLQEKITGMMKTLNRLKKIVQALLYISRIENDQFAKADEVIIHRLIREVREELADRVENRNIRFSVKVDTGIKLVSVNHDLLFQLVYNLVNNAIRYNREGGEIMITDQLIDGKAYILNLQDTGIGIPEENLETIFDRFKKSAHTREEGYGLGLSIAKSISDYHGIKLEVRSIPGAGTEFKIIFPVILLG